MFEVHAKALISFEAFDNGNYFNPTLVKCIPHAFEGKPQRLMSDFEQKKNAFFEHAPKYVIQTSSFELSAIVLILFYCECR